MGRITRREIIQNIRFTRNYLRKFHFCQLPTQFLHSILNLFQPGRAGGFNAIYIFGQKTFVNPYLLGKSRNVDLRIAFENIPYRVIMGFFFGIETIYMYIFIDTFPSDSILKLIQI